MTGVFRPELIDLFIKMPEKHRKIWERMTGGETGKRCSPDVTIAPEGAPYLYRWYMQPNDKTQSNEMFHIQVASDPERPLHDHPWDNVSVILAGKYDEILCADPQSGMAPMTVRRKKGDVVLRYAYYAHRLVLPEGTPYVMTRFVTGPKLREWGFWYPDGWHHNEQHVAWRGNESIYVNRM
jgi:hypothetical protein